MDTFFAAVILVVLAAAAWWWLRGRGSFTVAPDAVYTLSVNQHPISFGQPAGTYGVAVPFKTKSSPPAGAAFTLSPAPGALAGVPGATGDAFTLVKVGGAAAGRTLGGLLSNGVLVPSWGAPNPFLLEVRDDGAILRASGFNKVYIRSDGTPTEVEPTGTVRDVAVGEAAVENYDMRNMVLFAQADDNNRVTLFSPSNSGAAPVLRGTTSLLQLNPV